MSTPAESAEPSSARDVVLVVEDEPGIVDFVSRGLTAEGFDLLAAADDAPGSRPPRGSRK